MEFKTVENVCADCSAIGCPDRTMAFLIKIYCTQEKLRKEAKPTEEEPAEKN